jgi:hypothetical protein
MDPLLRYGWPGNVRELRSVIFKTLLFASSPVIYPEDLPRLISSKKQEMEQSEKTLVEVEYEKVKSSLQVSTWHKRSSCQERHFYVPSCNLLPLPEFLFWVCLAASAYYACLPLLGVAGAASILQIYQRSAGAVNNGIPIKRMAVAGAVIRTSLSLLYHLCLYVSRYYVVACALLWPLSARLSACALAMHLLAGIVQFQIRRPRLNLLSFLAFFSLDQAAYQLGVWWGCCRRGFFKPLLPRLVFSLTALKNSN